ncbi:MAG: SMC-Scp complex subunit ScpB [Sporomusaceae bacterium]|jgi:segregation and condensation protein B|nr:SMC-Scp complex subunit ScpB [Sporomusaceae bacterium]
MQKKSSRQKDLLKKKTAIFQEHFKQIKLPIPPEKPLDLSGFSLEGAVEAIIFAAGEPIAASKIAAILAITPKQAALLASDVIASYNEAGRGIMVGEVAGGYQMFTKPVYAATVSKIAAKREAKLSPAALETLAVIAFKQPVTRLEIENVRGVKVDGIVNMLLERLLIKEVGRKEVVGRPVLYGTTEEFLLCFGLKSLAELPPLAELLPDAENNPAVLPQP